MCREKMNYFDESISNPDWKEYVNDKKEGALIETRLSAAGLNCVKGSGIAPFPIDDVFQVIGDSQNFRRKYDKVYESSHIMKKVGHQTMFVYQRSKKISLVSSRDFILCLHYNLVFILVLLIIYRCLMAQSSIWYFLLIISMNLFLKIKL